jgi:hypothetical protein
MTARQAQIATVVLVLILAGVLLFAGTVPRLRTAHARPATTPAAALPAKVAVTPGGKLFHDPSCPYIHGPVVMMNTAEAEQSGYTPCTRCLKRAY